jgi:hypothetical protein
MHLRRRRPEFSNPVASGKSRSASTLSAARHFALQVTDPVVLHQRLKRSLLQDSQCLRGSGREGAPADLRAHQGALAAKKTGGARLGNSINIAQAGELGRGVQTAAADEFVAGLLPIIQAISSTGATTLRDMTDALNQHGIRSARDGRCLPIEPAWRYCG